MIFLSKERAAEVNKKLREERRKRRLGKLRIVKIMSIKGKGGEFFQGRISQKLCLQRRQIDSIFFLNHHF